MAPDTHHPKKQTPACVKRTGKTPRDAMALLTREEVRGRRVWLMFLPFGSVRSMVPYAPLLVPSASPALGLRTAEREFVYVYGAVSPIEGDKDWMISQKMRMPEQMTLVLCQVERRSPGGLQSSWCWTAPVPTKPKIFRGPHPDLALPPMPLNSTPDIYGMSFEKRNSRTGLDDLAAVIRPLQQAYRAL